MKLRGKDIAYLTLGLGTLIAHYVIPYSFLRSASGFTLYAFWGCLVLAWLAITLAYLRRW